MCGIFGLISNGKSDISVTKIEHIIRSLFVLSESRGKEAAGICLVNSQNVIIDKECIRAKKMIQTQEFVNLLSAIKVDEPCMIMGHARMVTNGSSRNNENNQPVVKNNLTCIHNGIIVNDNDIWKNHENFKRQYEVDTEIFLELLQENDFLHNPIKAIRIARNEIKGSLSTAVLDDRGSSLVLFTNIGSLYCVIAHDNNLILFASEKYILKELIDKNRLGKWFSKEKICQIEPETGRVINLSSCDMDIFGLNDLEEKNDLQITVQNRIKKELSDRKENCCSIVDKRNYLEIEKLMRVDVGKIHGMKRCTCCLLPETFPGISFDQKGECSICKSYKKMQKKNSSEFEAFFTINSGMKLDYDCIVPLSGGRDSCYMIHYMVKELGLHPVAYTYDWGMVTDLARRNIQRMCAELHIEHILISADITRKRNNIHKNVTAWLNKPSLATVPLFMAGDKQFFYYAQMLKKQMQVKQIVFGMNALEETKFKVRFAGMADTGRKGIHYDLSTINKVQMCMAYGKEFITNPAYINSSLLDSFGGFLSYYLLPKDYIQFFDYFEWDEKEVVNTIIQNYGWETAKDTKETWRIGDGTAPFYNYIYYRMAGFSEFDTFKSNQIREGLLDRDSAIASIDASNEVPVEAFVWYCDAVNIDPVEAIKIINHQVPLYDRLL